jgi:hypothetical protein
LPGTAFAAWEVNVWTGERLPADLEVWGYRAVDPGQEAWGYPVVSPDRDTVREELARLEAVWPGLELTVYLAPILAKPGICGKGEFIGGVYLPGRRAVVVFGQPKVWVSELVYDVEFHRIVRHEVGHAVWFQLMTEEERRARTAQKGLSPEEAVEAWAGEFERAAGGS